MTAAESKAIVKDHERLKDNLMLIQKNSSVSELSDLLQISKPTWIKKMKEPWSRFSYDDLKAISVYCKVDFTQLLTGVLKIR